MNLRQKYKQKRKEKLIAKFDKWEPFYKPAAMSKPFVWDAQSKTKFLNISEEMYDAYLAATKKAIQVCKENMALVTKRGKPKYYDYEAFVVVFPYLETFGDTNIKYPNPRYPSDSEHDYRVWCKFFDLASLPTFDRTTSWNIEELDIFTDGEYVTYYMHGLVSHLKWQIEDILAINHIYIKTVLSFQKRWRKDKVITFEEVVIIN